MAWSLLANTVKGSPNATTATTSAIDTTGADLLLVTISDYIIVSPSTLTDSKGNTWTALTSYQNAAVTRETIYYVQGGTVGTNHTFQTTLSNSYPSIAVMAWSGSVASPFRNESGNNTTLGTTLQPTASVGVNTDLVVTGIGGNSTTESFSIDSGFTISDQIPSAAGQCIGVGFAYKTVSGAEQPTWTSSVSIDLSTGIAAFKVSSGGGIIYTQLERHTRGMMRGSWSERH